MGARFMAKGRSFEEAEKFDLALQSYEQACLFDDSLYGQVEIIKQDVEKVLYLRNLLIHL